MKKFIFFFLIFLFYPQQIFAAATDKHVTVVNPVRARNLWQSVDSVKRQIDLTGDYKIPATWLLQYDVIIDDIALEQFKKLPRDQELGVFLEISEKLAIDSYVAYLLGVGDWARPDKVLLSGYMSNERKRMIDTLFEKFKSRFGYYPTSVGAWYIDTLSLDYMAKKYHIQATLDVSDQYSTDKYGLWGKPWGMPYIPSYFNSLMPAKNADDKLDVVKIQWAARDPVKGYGLSAKDSVYSIQANDYINNGFNTEYFKKLTDTYLNSENPIAQLTVGLEAGQEGAVFFEEYKKQLQYLKDLQEKNKINLVTMSSFASEYKKQFPLNSVGIFISGSDYLDPSIEAYWYSNSSYRIGLIRKNNKLVIRDLRIYPSYFLYEDVYTRDISDKLSRVLPPVIDELLIGNTKVLFSDVEDIRIVRGGDDVELLVKNLDGSDHKVLLTSDNIYKDQEVIFENIPKTDASDTINKILAQGIIKYWLSYPHVWVGGWRFAIVNNQFYFGFMNVSDQLIGLKSQFPFFGSFNFPFQTLIRFRTIPNLDIARFLSEYLVKYLNNSTIKIQKSYSL